MNIKKLFALNLKRLRSSTGLNQSELAEKANLSRNTVAMMEQGKAFPSAESLENLAKALAINPTTLFLDLREDISPFIKKNGCILNPGENPLDLIAFVSAFLRQGPTLQKIVLALIFEDERYLDDLPEEERRAVLRSVKDF